MEPKLSILPLRTVVAAVANTGEVTAIYRTFCLSEYFLSFQWLEALQGSSSCDSGRWGCGEDLYAYLLYQQQVSHFFQLVRNDILEVQRMLGIEGTRVCIR
ncbi:hypothetical protein FF1_024937 [Malus domestica]